MMNIGRKNVSDAHHAEISSFNSAKLFMLVIFFRFYCISVNVLYALLNNADWIFGKSVFHKFYVASNWSDCVFVMFVCHRCSTLFGYFTMPNINISTLYAHFAHIFCVIRETCLLFFQHQNHPVLLKTVSVLLF